VDGSEQFLSIALPSREHASYAAAFELLKGSGFALEPSNRRWWLRDRHRVLNFLAAHGSLLRVGFPGGVLSRTLNGTPRISGRSR
jgi:hypothetical protein